MTLATADSATGPVREHWVERRVGLIWALLFFNGMPPIGRPLIPIPHAALKILPAAAVALAAMLAAHLNRRMLIRPNLVLGLYTLLLATAVMTSIRFTAGIGAVLRCGRLAAFLATLWLLTPWWGRDDMLLLRSHLRILLLVLGSVVIGLVIAPSRALNGLDGRLAGILWPIPAPQVAQYAAVAAGCALVLWLWGSMSRRHAFLIAACGIGLIGISHTRTALLAMGAGLTVAALSLILSRRRVRQVFAAILIVAPLAVFVAAPAVAIWFQRGQSSSQIAGLTGRKAVWAGVLNQPRSEFNRWFGFGLSDKSSNGHPIDDTWLAVYRDEGIAGDLIVGGIVLLMLIAPHFHPPGPERAVALFLVVYVAVASYAEVTLGDATPYFLHIVLAAALIVPAARRPRRPSEPVPG